MSRKKIVQQAVAVLIIFAALFGDIGLKYEVYAANTNTVLKQGMKNVDVEEMQQRLKELNYFNANVTGFYGDITKKSVMSFQKSRGLAVDGIAGPQTLNALYNQQNTTAIVSRGDANRGNILTPWFNDAENIFSLGTEAVVTDVVTGISFKVKRTGGTNHADTETLSKEDTALLKKVFGGIWNWERRAVIVTVGETKIAASMTGMPHAGRDDKPAREVINNRSDGYGKGVNYDSIKGNDMDGHFDIHFLGSKTHGSNRVDGQHQAMIQKASQSYNN